MSFRDEDEDTIQVLQEVRETFNYASLSQGEERAGQIKRLGQIVAGHAAKVTSLVDAELLQGVTQFAVADRLAGVEVKVAVLNFVDILCTVQPIYSTSNPIVVAVAQLVEGSNHELAARRQAISLSSLLLRCCMRQIVLNTEPTMQNHLVEIWKQYLRIKDETLRMVQSTSSPHSLVQPCLVFLETAILCFSQPPANTPSSSISLRDVPYAHWLNPRFLEQESTKLLDTLVRVKPTTSMVLTVLVNTFVHLGKERPQHIQKIINAMENLLKNVDTFPSVERRSVNKALELCVFQLLKSERFSDAGTIDQLYFFAVDLGLEDQARRARDELARKFDIGKPERKRARDDIFDSMTTSIPATSTMEKRVKVETPQVPPSSSGSSVAAVQQVVQRRTLTSNDIRIILDLPADAAVDVCMKCIAESETVAAATQINTLGASLSQFLERPVSVPYVRAKLLAPSIGASRDPRKLRDPRLRSEPPALPTQPSISVTPKMTKIPELKVARLNPQQARELQLRSFGRILNAESSTRTAGGESLRHELVSRLLLQEDLRSEQLIDFRNYVFEDPESRFPVLLHWIVAEFSAAVLSGDYSRYHSIVSEVVKDCVQTYDLFQSMAFSAKELLAALPLLNEESLEILCTLTATDQRTKISECLVLLKDYILRRPPMRNICLHKLLLFSQSTDLRLRTMAIRLLTNKLFVVDFLSDPIAHYATSSLDKIVGLEEEIVAELHPSVNEMSDETAGNEPPRHLQPEISKRVQEDTYRLISLYLSLCVVKPELLLTLVDRYPSFPKDAKHSIDLRIDTLITALDSESVLLAALERVQSTKEAFPFVLRCLTAYTENATPSTQMVDQLKLLYRSKSFDVGVLVPVITQLPKEEILDCLPELVRISQADTVIRRLLKGKPPIVAPSQLLFRLHEMEIKPTLRPTNAKATRGLTDALKACYESKQALSQEEFAAAIQRVVDLPEIPRFFMLTVLKALDVYHMKAFVLQILKKLVVKQAVKISNKVLFEGFLRACKSTIPESLELVASLDVEQLKAFAKNYPEYIPLLLKRKSVTGSNEKAASLRQLRDEHAAHQQQLHVAKQQQLQQQQEEEQQRLQQQQMLLQQLQMR